MSLLAVLHSGSLCRSGRAGRHIFVVIVFYAAPKSAFVIHFVSTHHSNVVRRDEEINVIFFRVGDESIARLEDVEHVIEATHIFALHFDVAAEEDVAVKHVHFVVDGRNAIVACVGDVGIFFIFFNSVEEVFVLSSLELCEGRTPAEEGIGERRSVTAAFTAVVTATSIDEINTNELNNYVRFVFMQFFPYTYTSLLVFRSVEVNIRFFVISQELISLGECFTNLSESGELIFVNHLHAIETIRVEEVAVEFNGRFS